MKYDVFISYSHKDKAVAFELCESFEREGLQCWIAPRNVSPGSSWAEGIVQGIGDSRVMVLVWTESSNLSKQVHREIERAIDKGLVIIPVRLEEVKPAPALEYCLSLTHWYDATEQPLHRYVPDLTRLVRSSAQTSHDAPSPTPATTPRPAGTSPPQNSAARRGQKNSLPLYPALVAIGILICLLAVSALGWGAIQIASQLAAIAERIDEPEINETPEDVSSTVHLQVAAPSHSEPPRDEPPTAAPSTPAAEEISPGRAMLSDRVEAANEKVYDALAEDTQFEMFNVPLADVAAFVADMHGIPVRIDRAAIGDVGMIEDDLLVTFSASGIPLAAAFRAALSDMDLAFAVRDGCLWIAPPDAEVEDAKRVPSAAELRLIRRLAEIDDSIHAKLAADADLDLFDLPLEELAYVLREQHQIHVRLDQAALAQEGLSEIDGVTVSMKDLPLGVILRAALGDLDLDYVVSDGVLTITSREAARKRNAVGS